ncbi:MAG: type II toxin-antitoxin system YafQ family toxin [Campylobacterota bacterium]|nr:type II toxin-antitoxin system YafQ family toxin [Campylobacterota bacterium]
MLNIFRTKTFIKDYRGLKLSDKHYTKYINYLSILINENSLPTEALDHDLKGNMKDFREFHISGDILVVYTIEENFLKLVRIGSHTQVFS